MSGQKYRRTLTYVRVSPGTREVTRVRATDIGLVCRFGQGEMCEVVVRKEGVSYPVHARLSIEDANKTGATIFNLDQRRPTLLNGSPVLRSASVSSGDIITICGKSFLFEEFELVGPHNASEKKQNQDAAEDQSSSEDEEVENSSGKESMGNAFFVERLELPKGQRQHHQQQQPTAYDLSASQPDRGYNSEPPHIMDRREQSHSQDSDSSQRIGFNIEFPVRKDSSMFLPPDEVSGSTTNSSMHERKLAECFEDTTERRRRTSEEEQEKDQEEEEQEEQEQEPAHEKEQEPEEENRETNKGDGSPLALSSDDDEGQEEEKEEEEEVEEEDEEVEEEDDDDDDDDGDSDFCGKKRGRSEPEPPKLVWKPLKRKRIPQIFAGIHVVIGPCINMDYVVNVVMTCGGTVGPFSSRPDQMKPWEAEAPKVFYVARPQTDGGIRLVGQALLSLSMRIPVVNEQWIIDCYDSGSLLSFKKYLLKVQPLLPGKTTVNQPLKWIGNGENIFTSSAMEDTAEPPRFKLLACDRLGFALKEEARRKMLQPIEWLIVQCGGTLAMETKRTYFATLVVVDEHGAASDSERKHFRIEDMIGSSPFVFSQFMSQPPVLSVRWLFACVLNGKMVPTDDYKFDLSATPSVVPLQPFKDKPTSTPKSKPKLKPKPKPKTETKPKTEVKPVVSVAKKEQVKKQSPKASKAKTHSMFEGLQFILELSANTAFTRRAIEQEKGVIVQSLPLIPKSQIDLWNDPKILLLTEHDTADTSSSGLFTLCLSLAIPVIQCRWIRQCVLKKKRIPIDNFLVPVCGMRDCSVSQPIEFARSGSSNGILTDEDGRPLFVKLVVVGRDGYEVCEKGVRSQLKNIENIIGLMGGGVAQDTRRHYLANVFVTDVTKDSSSARGYISIQNCDPNIPNVTVQWLYESIVQNKRLPFSEFIFEKPSK